MVVGIGMVQSAGCMPHAKLSAGIATELRKHVEVAFFLWYCGKHVQKIYFHETCPGGLSSNMPKKINAREICPKNICPGNVSKLHMSEGHATFKNVSDGC